MTFIGNSGGVRGGKGECPEVNFNGSHSVSLHCSDPSYARATLVQWRWTDSLGNWKEHLLLQVLNGKVTEHPGRSNLGLSRERCMESGDCSLTMTPTGDDVGLYHCVVWTNTRITEEQSLLAYKAGPKALRATYVAVGVCGGLLLLLALVGFAWICRRKGRGQAQSSESQNHRGNNINLNATYVNQRRNLNSTYMGLNLSDRHLYSNLGR
ncbi:uncharacterized protein LOC121270983 isoform X2 [Carcharodon carcharias]|uniref:uncharacterized protein LOC121270983 isoform X2 n=1 Tax=Carcharodon carcharias TaxID=13397 RepID=UPI001B7E4D92|nr:uncharacterized protein LOC121270983 isoform X2 [Carcharodon carcharias]